MIRFSAILLAIVLSAVIGVVHGAAYGLTAATLLGAALMKVRESAGFAFAVGPLNLLDLALRSGKHVHAVLEGVLTVAIEMATFKSIPLAGLEYSTLACISKPAGDFRKVGGGVGLQKSEWKREVGSMSVFEAQMYVAEDVLIQAKSRNAELTDGDVLASEAIRHLEGSAIRIGSQTWYGQKISEDGFAGLSTQVDAANEVNAGGANNVDTSSVYLIDLDANPVNPEGVHYVIGNGGRMNFKESWLEQRVEVSAGKYSNGFANNFLSYMGLVVPRKESLYRVKNVKEGNPFTDTVAANLLAKIPLALRKNKSRLRWFMNTESLRLLHLSRITAAAVVGVTYVPEPTEVAGIQIELTDSLITTERNGVKA